VRPAYTDSAVGEGKSGRRRSGFTKFISGFMKLNSPDWNQSAYPAVKLNCAENWPPYQRQN
jgi:hypothetical protein